MNPSVFVLLLHIGGIIKTLRDVELAIADVAKGGYKASDVQAVLDDLLALVGSGVIVLPGMSQDDVKKAIGDLRAAF